MKKQLLIVLLIAISIGQGKSVLAQSNFEPGYIITNDTKVKHGFIDNRNWLIHPREIAFKESVDAVVQIYDPSSIKGFSVNGLLFESKLVSYDDSPHQLHRLTRETQPIMVEGQAFVQVFYKGPKSLYYFIDPNGKEHFFIEKDGVMEWLYFKQVLGSNHPSAKVFRSGYHVETIERFKGQLILYLADCPNIDKAIHKTGYNSNALYELFSYYYKHCGGEPEYHYQYEQRKISHSIIPVIGLTSIKSKFTGTTRPWLRDAEFSRSTDFSFGIGIESKPSGETSRFSVYNELSYHRFKTEASMLYFSIPDFETWKHSHFDVSHLKIKVLPQYTIVNSDLKLFGNAGMGLGFIFNQKNSLITERISPSGTIIDTETALEDESIRKFDVGIIFGLGASYKGINLKLNHEISKGISLINGLSNPSRRFYVLVGYEIKLP